MSMAKKFYEVNTLTPQTCPSWELLACVILRCVATMTSLIRLFQRNVECRET